MHDLVVKGHNLNKKVEYRQNTNCLVPTTQSVHKTEKLFFLYYWIINLFVWVSYISLQDVASDQM